MARTTATVVRRGQTGKPGNKGQFDGVEHAESDEELAADTTTVAVAPVADRRAAIKAHAIRMSTVFDCTTAEGKAAAEREFDAWRETQQFGGTGRLRSTDKAIWKKQIDPERNAAAKREYNASRAGLKQHRKERHILRAKQALSAYDPKLDEDKIYERDGWTGQICDGAIDDSHEFYHPSESDDDNERLVANDQYKSLDHVIPLVFRGGYVADNLQATHQKCNNAKSNKLPMDRIGSVEDLAQLLTDAQAPRCTRKGLEALYAAACDPDTATSELVKIFEASWTPTARAKMRAKQAERDATQGGQ